MKNYLTTLTQKARTAFADLNRALKGKDYDIKNKQDGSTLREILNAVDPTFSSKITNWGHGSDLNALAGYVRKRQLINYFFDNGHTAKDLTPAVILQTMQELHDKHAAGLKSPSCKL